MPYRQQVIVPGEIYHVFNRSVAKIPIFEVKNDYKRALEVFSFYSYEKTPMSFSKYNRLSVDQKKNLYEQMRNNLDKNIEIISFCLMPNHIHFLLKEIKIKGITNFMRKFQDSYAKYYNTKSDRNGAVFQARFKVIRVESDEQLLHLARYIHLNPLTTYLVKDVIDLDRYAWSSWMDYLGLREEKYLSTDLLKNHFPSLESFKKFTLDQADYQRTLSRLKHLSLE
ncbi:hypothetical protein A3H85_00430 [Candidatus Daviesbacteria bacterium RIFCSPLOWO2_02_FULL_40_8]|uniref:Transposase IS200-like domain-containing protein n=1 Tax=Candidatus Daviesbacteria bacterium RIFCSPLOWO2_01_FULL_40_24 TaxID=1797787 RepID=A0A1F5MJT4_9BACT|nr:MAG: hypothetical protein A2780_00935 [Candidatus Daviesbacteria bacterium RIFCSPHIGHO2_01_FULL_41_45]OGE34052.1 MAG: hypothetical protein A3C32_01425 [Candidatus Daviesbacteria bacterium RIFCSPHIGHO2_02_FULL_41_14]OGE65647.1 MAG: hypothetical protein A3B49_00195 [Candidatus Daviesbacteria bacterium RIFCSPLOWO2_01_FULL_40_24]OGE65931.1 MAG: hypothetical protein A3H85_00430 [Candidatus Daviesbacteria bacterium RIFCSPLOWO2_02_FULL_40_8]